MKVYSTCILFIPVNGNEDKNWVGVKFAILRSNPWCQFIVLLEIGCKDNNIHENVENKIFDLLLHKAQNASACHKKICKRRQCLSHKIM